MAAVSDKIKIICEAADEKKAEDIVIMDMNHAATLCDHFVVMSAPSSIRARTIAEHIESTMKQRDWRTLHREGYQEGLWVLLDYGDIVVHVFNEETRRFYALEHLWGDSRKKSYKAL